MPWLWLCLMVLACASPAYAVDPIMSGGTPGRDMRDDQDAQPENPGGEQGWLDWVLDLTQYYWALFLQFLEWVVYRPAEWLRDLLKSWFCWIATGIINFLARLVPFDQWQKEFSGSYVNQGILWVAKFSTFFAEVFPFKLWALLVALWLGVEAGIATVKWIIALIPGT